MWQDASREEGTFPPPPTLPTLGRGCRYLRRPGSSCRNRQDPRPGLQSSPERPGLQLASILVEWRAPGEWPRETQTSPRARGRGPTVTSRRARARFISRTGVPLLGTVKRGRSRAQFSPELFSSRRLVPSPFLVPPFRPPRPPATAVAAAAMRQPGCC